MSFMDAIERGLARTQLESLLDPLVTSACALPLPFDDTRGEEPCGEVAEDEVDDRPRPRDGLGDSSVRRRFGVSGGSGVGCACARPSRLAFSLLLFLSSVARSGLLAVPGERYMERRFVCKSVSSSAS